MSTMVMYVYMYICVYIYSYIQMSTTHDYGICNVIYAHERCDTPETSTWPRIGHQISKTYWLTRLPTSGLAVFL